jgi:hypothetical protein
MMLVPGGFIHDPHENLGKADDRNKEFQGRAGIAKVIKLFFFFAKVRNK